MAAGENLELSRLQFEDHGAGDTQFLARCSPGLFRETPDHWLHLGQQDILFKRVLGGYGLCWPVRDYLAVVDSPSQLVETHAITAEAAFECRQIHSPQIGDRFYLKVLQFFFRDFAYSG